MKEAHIAKSPKADKDTEHLSSSKEGELKGTDEPGSINETLKETAQRIKQKKL